MKQILARVKVGDCGYSLIQTVEGVAEWHKDSMICNVQAELAQEFSQCKQVNYSTVFSEMQSKDQQMHDCLKQYEERLQRCSQQMERSDAQYLTC